MYESKPGTYVSTPDRRNHKHTLPGAGGSLAWSEGRGSEGNVGEMRPERQQVGPIEYADQDRNLNFILRRRHWWI